jgi:hypothetical protein
VNQPLAPSSANPDSRPAHSLEPKARSVVRHPVSSLLLCAVLLAVWCVPFVRLAGRDHSLYGLLGLSKWVAVPISMLLCATLATVLMLPQKVKTMFFAIVFLALTIGQMRLFLPFEDTARPLPLVGYWLGLAVMSIMTARVIWMIEAQFAEWWSYFRYGDRRMVKPQPDDAQIGSMNSWWRRLLVTLPSSLALLYGVPILLGLFGVTAHFVYLVPWAFLCPIFLTRVIRLARVAIR